MKKITVLSLCAGFMLFSFVPCLSAGLSGFSEDQEPSEACMAAIKDAKNSVNGWVWFGAGCLLNFVGVIAANVAPSFPPSGTLIGKNSAYAADYGKCYQKRASAIQNENAWSGFYWSFTLYGAVILGFFFFNWMNTMNSMM